LNVTFGKKQITAENRAETVPLGDLGDPTRRLAQQRGSLLKTINLAKQVTHFRTFP
jgi:hypothetical protein